MCTVSWRCRPGAYRLYFNRDEQRSRPIAEPPTIETIGGVTVILPHDPLAGGTWIASNAYGLTVAILNYYDAEANAPQRDSHRSRGLLVRELSGSASLEAARAAAEDHDLPAYRPFHLLLMSPAGAASGTWSGRELRWQTQPPRTLLSTSSFETESVLKERRAAYARFLADDDSDEAHRAFHASHDPERSAFSVCMHRDDARTVSYTEVFVDDESVELAYGGDAPCRCAFDQLERQRIGRIA